MSVVLWILAGAALGGAAHALTRSRNRTEIALNVVTGIAGVVSCGWLLGAVTGMSAFNPETFFIASLLVSLLGATVLLTALQVFRGRRSGATATRPDYAPAPFAVAGHATPTQMRELK